MATVKEYGNPRRLAKTEQGYERNREFLVEGALSEESALEASGGPDVLPEVGVEYAPYSMICSRLEATPLPDDKNDDKWIVRATYRPKTRNDSQTAQPDTQRVWSWSTQTVSKHITQALNKTPLEKTFVPSGATKIASGGVIGWDGKKIQGADIPSTSFKFSVSLRYAEDDVMAGDVIYSYCDYYVNHYNSKDWGLWKAGEVLLEACSGRYQPGGVPTVTGDDAGQLGDVSKIENVRAATSTGGSLYCTIEKYDGLANYKIYLYKDPEKTILVASNEMAAIGWNDLTPSSISGSPDIRGRIELCKYVRDTDSIVIQFPFPWEVKFDFAISKNEDSYTIGDITVTDKLGWEYADVKYASSTLTVDGKEVTVEKPHTVYLHTVLVENDFNDLPFDIDDFITHGF